MVSNDHNLAVASADADSRYLGGPAEPLRGSKDREYTGPLWPMSFRVELPPFSRIFWMDPAKGNVD
jgi:hypothetical protein